MKYLITALLPLSLVACATDKSGDFSRAHSTEKSTPSAAGCNAISQWVFSWPIQKGCEATRGGTTRGPEVTETDQPDPRWKALRQPGLSKFERDRRAILAMAGGFKTTFEFIEVLGFTPGYQFAKPYQSWATEYVYVAVDEPEYISLQHIIVMYFIDDYGKTQGPVVMKHWRQDWRYEDPSLLEYQGNQQWQLITYPTESVAGTWTQTVYQVDDTPRYASYGVWRHSEDFSRWQGSTTWRPLPRREYSVRDDYQVLEGDNTLTITATGWVHEQENLKRISASRSEPAHYLAKELGFNRYRRIKDFDFSAGDTYWQNTASYWALVRQALDDMVRQNNGNLQLKPRVNGKPLFVPLFDYARSLNEGETFNPEKAAEFIRATLRQYSN